MKTALIPYLIRRYLRFDSAQPFITITALLAFAGVAIGVMVLIISMAIMNGFDKEFQRKLFIMNYPITLYPKTSERIGKETLIQLEEAFPELQFSPYLSSQMIARGGDNMQGGMMFGVDFDKERKINAILDEALGDREPEKFHAVIGKELSRQLFVNPGDRMMLIFTAMEASGFAVTPTMKRFTVDGVFHSGLNAYDRSYVFTTLESLRVIVRAQKDRYDGIRIYSEKPFEDIERIKELLPFKIGAVGWWQQNGNFFAALQLEKRALFIVLMLIILVASLNIISSLLMTVMSRRKEIALLLSLGASRTEIRKLFFYLGMIVGNAGMVLGTILGLIGIWLLGSFDIVSLPADVYPSSKLPLVLSLFDFGLIVAGSFVIILLSSYYPAKKASQVDALSVLRNE